MTMHRTRHRVDLLPLLDVFMVVLFVFASIQEETLQHTQAEHADVLAQARQQDVRLAMADAAWVRANAEVERLEQALAIEQTRAHADEVALGGVEALRQRDLLARMRAGAMFVEVEVSGRSNDDGSIINHCCYRIGEGTWHSCGDVPVTRDALEQWRVSDPDFVQVLGAPKADGPRFVFVRQNAAATYAIATRIGDVLRARYRDAQVYDGRADFLLETCAR